MLRTLRVLSLAAATLLLLAVATAGASEVRVLASDASGVTLKVTTGRWTLEPKGDQGRFVPNADGMSRTIDPGRPRLPYATALIALPPGARAVARLVSSGAEETRDGVKIAVGGKPGFEKNAGVGTVPTIEPVDPIRDGVWPAQPVEAGTPITMRERRLASVQVYPFRYDEAASRLTVTSELVVRVDFVGGGRLSTAALDDAPDPQFDPVFATQVINWREAQGWRARRPAARDRGLLPSRTSLSLPGVSGTLPFDESSPEVRVRIDTTGVYELLYDSLAVYGYPANVPVANVSVHRHEFVEDQIVPYETIDLPIEIVDDGDGTFGDGDKILVWVRTWADRARPSTAQRPWGEAEVVYATVKPGAPRIDHRSGWLGRSDLTPLTSYPWRDKFERNLSYTAFPTDTLMDSFSWSSFAFFCSTDDYAFPVNDPDPTQPGALTVQWTGLNGIGHITWAAVRNAASQTTVPIDSAAWSGIRHETETGPLPAGFLSNGNNTLMLWGKSFAADNCTGGATPIVSAGLNWFELQYWRAYKPLNEYLSANSGTQTSDFEIRAGPFTYGAPFVYDVSDSTHPYRLDNTVVEVSGGIFVRLQDTASPSLQRRYVIFDQARSPAPGAMSAVTRRRTFDHTAGDYLIVVPEGFRAAVQPLADLHTAQGQRVVVAPLESVQDEFNGGRKSPYAIKRFVRYAYNNWNARFVLLVGDGSLDPQKNIAVSSPDIVPVSRMFGPVPTSFGLYDFLREIVVSDFWYVWCMNCIDPPLTDLVPDLYVGRLPVSTLSQVNSLVSKIVSYDDLSGDLSWRRKMLLLSDDAYSGETTFGGGSTGSSYCRKPGELVFAEINAIVDSLIRKRAGLGQSQVDLFNLSYYTPNRPGEFTTSGGADTCRNSLSQFVTRARATATPEMFNRLNAGQMWWNYQGHANQNVLAHEQFYINNGGTTTDDKVQFTNTNKPFFWTAFSCHPNAFGDIRGGNDPQWGPSIGEEMINLPAKGAVASWASTGFEALPQDETSHINIYLAQSMFVNPPHDEVLGDRGARGVLGEILMAALLTNFQRRLVWPYERDVAVTYTLLGDPLTRLSIGQPQSVVTANTVPVTSGQQIRLHTSGTALTLDATLASNVRLDTLSLSRVDASGTTVIWRSTDASLPAGLTLTPAFPDTAAATTVNGGRLFRLTYADNLRPESYRYVFRSVDRYGVVGTFDAVFDFQVTLRSGGAAILDGDIVAPNADLSLLVLSPVPLTPATDLTLEIGGANQPFVATAANGDVSGREWLLTWTHSPYAAGDYVVKLTPTGGPSVFRSFRVSETGLSVRLENAYAFPNPFDDDYLRALSPGLDTAVQFSFDLISGAPADVTLRVYSISGRLIYQRTDRQLSSSWHQMSWNGRDAEGSTIANGVYFYKLLASNGTGKAVKEGRLVKLRRPRRAAVANEP